MDIITRLECCDEARITGQVGDTAQFDLVVVGHQKYESRCRYERPSESSAQFGPYRNVVQVRGV